MGRFCCHARDMEVGSKPFNAVSKANGLKRLGMLLHLIGVPKAVECKTQDVRRGHAQDLVEAGGTLVEPLAAGEWGYALWHGPPLCLHDTPML